MPNFFLLTRTHSITVPYTKAKISGLHDPSAVKNVVSALLRNPLANFPTKWGIANYARIFHFTHHFVLIEFSFNHVFFSFNGDKVGGFGSVLIVSSKFSIVQFGFIWWRCRPVFAIGFVGHHSCKSLIESRTSARNEIVSTEVIFLKWIIGYEHFYDGKNCDALGKRKCVLFYITVAVPP